MPAHVQPDGRVCSFCHRAYGAKYNLVAHVRAADGFRHQGHAKTATHQSDQGVDLRGFLYHLRVKTGGLAQGNQLAVIAAAQGLGGENEVFAGEIP